MSDKDLTATDDPYGKKPDDTGTGPSTTVPGAAGQGASAPDLDPQSRPAGGATPDEKDPGQEASEGTLSEPTANPVPPAADATTDPGTHDSPQLPPDHGQDRH